MIKELLNKRLFGKIYRLLSFQRNKNYIPFKYKSFSMPERLYSDFFISNNKFFKNIFIAENIYGLLTSKEEEVIHKLTFYSHEGKLLGSQVCETKELISKIELPKFDVQETYISFTHDSLPSKLDLIRNIDLGLQNKLSLQHRGYTNYIKNENSIGSIVHGNFGAIMPSDLEKSAAIIRSKKYIYTPVYFFEKINIYHLVFNNPTHKLLKIEIKGQNSLDKSFFKFNLSISSLGTEYLKIKDYTGKLSFISKLPICRCIIFKNPEIYQNSDFDVFHS